MDDPKFWGMKTFKSWAKDFVTNKIIGIDQTGVDDFIGNYSDDEIDDLITDGYMSRAILRNFKQFAYDMKIGDLVVIGVGQMTKFNIHSIVKIVGEYERKEVGGYPRHYRKIEPITILPQPILYEEYNRLSRLEYLSKYDWTEMMNYTKSVVPVLGYMCALQFKT